MVMTCEASRQRQGEMGTYKYMKIDKCFLPDFIQLETQYYYDQVRVSLRHAHMLRDAAVRHAVVVWNLEKPSTPF
jgi:hypothetical protein